MHLTNRIKRFAQISRVRKELDPVTRKIKSIGPEDDGTSTSILEAVRLKVTKVNRGTTLHEKAIASAIYRMT